MIIAVDFDGTIVEHKYPKIGKPIPFAIDVLKRLQNEGHTLILWTVREGDLLKEALDYCEKNDLRFYAANKNHPDEQPGESARKLGADLFIDDRNIGGLIGWGVIYQMIKAGTNNVADIEYAVEAKPHKKNFFTRLGEAIDRSKGNTY